MHDVSRYPTPDLDELPDDIAQMIGDIAERSGFVPNVFLAFARRPEEFRAFFAYYDALMERDSGLSKAEREMIVIVTSAENNCLYCVVSHGAVHRIRSKQPMLADQLAIDWRSAELTERERAICDFAVTLATDPAATTNDQRDRLLAAGLSEDDIWDVGAITALFALSNRMAHLTEMRPNPEFYTMGRG